MYVCEKKEEREKKVKVCKRKKRWIDRWRGRLVETEREIERESKLEKDKWR